MESLRRPSVLAAVAAAVLVINVVVLGAMGEDRGVTVDDPLAGATSEDAGGAGADPDGAGAGDAADDGAAEGGATGTDDGAAEAGGAAGQQAGAGSGTAGGGDNDDGTEDGGSALGVPVAGVYTYAGGGSWSLRSGGESEEHQLPATATGSVEVDGDAWQVRLAAGERYADRFGFALGADGGLDWSSWVLERQFGDAPSSETSYSCSGDAAYYLPAEDGRSVEHTCESDAGITSVGQVEHVGSEDVTLGDGTVVTADRLLYTYTVSGSGSEFEVTGDGRLDLWVDPATGLRLREQRSISTTTTFATGGESVYQEDVDFTLQSLTAS